jgi:hypothetical protein
MADYTELDADSMPDEYVDLIDGAVDQLLNILVQQPKRLRFIVVQVFVSKYLYNFVLPDEREDSLTHIGTCCRGSFKLAEASRLSHEPPAPPE